MRLQKDSKQSGGQHGIRCHSEAKCLNNEQTIVECNDNAGRWYEPSVQTCHSLKLMLQSYTLWHKMVLITIRMSASQSTVAYGRPRCRMRTASGSSLTIP